MENNQMMKEGGVEWHIHLCSPDYEKLYSA